MLALRVEDPWLASGYRLLQMQGNGREEPQLKGLIVSGLAWKGVSQVATQATRLLVAVVLARILAPHEYGLAGMVLVFTSFVLVLSDLALGSRLVQRRVLTDTDTCTAFWTSVGAGLIFTLLGVGLAGPIAALLGQPAIRPMIAVLSLTFFLSGITLTQSALLVRSMSFRALELRAMAGTFAGAALGILVALLGFGAWAIITQQLAASAVGTVLVWRYSTWRPQWIYSLASLRDFAGFSGNVLGATLFAQLRATSDNFLVGRFVGASGLGAYALGYNIVLVPFNRIAAPLSQVLFPAMSQIQDDLERMRAYWVRSVRVIAAISMPALLGLIVVAPDFVDVVLGPSWKRAVPVIQLLSVVALFQTLQFLNGTILQTVDRTNRLFKWSAFSYAAALASFVIGLHWGVVGVAAAFAVASAIIEPMYAALTAATISLPLRRYVRSLTGIAQASIAMAMAILAIRVPLERANIAPMLRLVVELTAGLALYAGLCRLRAPEVVEELQRLRRRERATPDLRTTSSGALAKNATSSV
jgi:O-antigen/teichoic acid export membrane protein